MGQGQACCSGRVRGPRRRPVEEAADSQPPEPGPRHAPMGGCCSGRGKDYGQGSSVLRILKTKALKGRAAELEAFIKKVAAEDAGRFSSAIRVGFFWPKEGEVVQVALWDSQKSLARHKELFRKYYRQELTALAETPTAFDFDGPFWRTYVKGTPRRGHHCRVVAYKLRENVLQEDLPEGDEELLREDALCRLGLDEEVLNKVWDLWVTPEAAGDLLVAAVASVPSPAVFMVWQVFKSKDASVKYLEMVRPKLEQVLDPVLDGSPIFQEEGEVKTLIPTGV